MSHAKQLQEIAQKVAKEGVNFTLEAIEQTTRYKRFRKKIQSDLFKQISFVAQNDTFMDTLLMLAKVDNPLEDQLKIFIGYALIQQDREEELASFMLWSGEQGGQGFYDKQGIDMLFGLRNPQFINYFNDHSRLVINSVDNTTKKWIAKIIQDGKNAGLSPFEIQQLLIDKGKDISAIRAERIILTETANAVSLVEIEAAKRMGFKEMVWRTTRDERVCPICGPLEGKKKLFDESYDNGVVRPPAHVSCRCVVEEVTPTEYDLPATMWTGV